MLTRIRDFYRKLEDMFLIMLMIVSTLIVGYSVFMRYIFTAPPIWSEELVCYFQVWIAFVGISYVARNPDDFIKFDFLIHKMNPKVRAVVSMIERVILLAFMGLLAVSSVTWIVQIYNFGGVSTPMMIPNYIPRITIPLSFILMFIHYIEAVFSGLRDIKKVFSKDDITEVV